MDYSRRSFRETIKKGYSNMLTNKMMSFIHVGVWIIIIQRNPRQFED